MEEKIIYGLDDLETAVNFLYNKLKKCSVITFEGSLGAGKTTLVKALLKRCGITEVITSPTFTYVNKYDNNGTAFFHFDCYRIHNVDEFIASGFGEYLNVPNSVCLIEWPEVINSLLPQGACKVKINYVGQDKRELIFHGTEK